MMDVDLRRKPDNVVISFPRSGTDFFCEALCVDQRIKYYREYFNPLCNQPRESVLIRCFGDERLHRYFNIMKETTASKFGSVVADCWSLDGFNTTKENFSATKLEHFDRCFNVIILVRKVFHTFPTTRPEYIVPILNSFMLAGTYAALPLSRELNELRQFISGFSIDDQQHAGIMAYIVQHYILVDAAHRYRIPIISYEDLITRDGMELENTIRCLTAFGADVAKVAGALASSRRGDSAAALGARRNRFAQVYPALWFRPVVEFICGLSPAIRPDLERLVYVDR